MNAPCPLCGVPSPVHDDATGKCRDCGISFVAFKSWVGGKDALVTRPTTVNALHKLFTDPRDLDRKIAESVDRLDKAKAEFASVRAEHNETVKHEQALQKDLLKLKARHESQTARKSDPTAPV